MHFCQRNNQIRKYERKLDCFALYLSKERRVQFSEWKDILLPLTANLTHTPNLLLCYYLEENNDMRDLRELNHRNLRLFDTQRHSTQVY